MINKCTWNDNRINIFYQNVCIIQQHCHYRWGCQEYLMNVLTYGVQGRKILKNSTSPSGLL